jgi:hypothetical protein
MVQTHTLHIYKDLLTNTQALCGVYATLTDFIIVHPIFHAVAETAPHMTPCPTCALLNLAREPSEP